MCREEALLFMFQQLSCNSGISSGVLVLVMICNFRKDVWIAWSEVSLSRVDLTFNINRLHEKWFSFQAEILDFKSKLLNICWKQEKELILRYVSWEMILYSSQNPGLEVLKQTAGTTKGVAASPERGWRGMRSSWIDLLIFNFESRSLVLYVWDAFIFHSRKSVLFFHLISSSRSFSVSLYVGTCTYKCVHMYICIYAHRHIYTNTFLGHAA